MYQCLSYYVKVINLIFQVAYPILSYPILSYPNLKLPNLT